MESENCFTCGSQLSSRGHFCPRCGTQARCQACGFLLEKDANACVQCGTLLNSKPNGALSHSLGDPRANNVIRFEESRTHRSLEAKFTDVAVDSLSSPFAAFFAGGLRPPARRTVQGQLPEAPIDVQIVEPAGLEQVISPNTPSATDPDHATAPASDEWITQLFRVEGQQLKLIEPRLKANSRRDHVARLSCLFLLAHELLGRQRIVRSDLNAALKNATVYDSNAASYISSSNDFIKDDDDLSLSMAGRENAKRFLAEVLDPGVTGHWTTSSAPKRRPKGSKDGSDASESTQNKARTKSSKSPSVEDWASQWKSKHSSIPAFDILTSRSNEDKGVFGLWAIKEVTGGLVTDVARGRLSKFIHSAFDIKVNERSLENALKKSSRAVPVSGATFRINPSGNSFVESLIRETSDRS